MQHSRLLLPDRPPHREFVQEVVPQVEEEPPPHLGQPEQLRRVTEPRQLLPLRVQYLKGVD